MCSQYMNSELRIQGTATIAFHPSGNWFQGNIISPSEDAYTIHGKRNATSSTVSSSPPAAPAFGQEGRSPTADKTCHLPAGVELDSKDGGHDYVTSGRLAGSDVSGRLAGSDVSGRLAGSDGSSSAISTSLDDEVVSVSDSLDSALIAETMERLELELDSEMYYTVNIVDYETGINHRIKEVCCVQEGESLSLEGESISFASTSTHKGIKADVIISSNIGPSLVQKGLTVFRGDLKMTYRDEPCFPVSLDASQWCL